MITPAAFVIDSFMMEPPMSLHPTFSSCAARSGPIFTQLACKTHAQHAEVQAQHLQFAAATAVVFLAAHTNWSCGDLLCSQHCLTDDSKISTCPPGYWSAGGAAPAAPQRASACTQSASAPAASDLQDR